MHTSRGDGVASIKRRRHNPSGDGVRKMMTASGCGRLKRGSRIIYMAMASVISAKNQEIVQGDRVNIQSRNSGNDARNTRHSYVQEEIIEGPSYDSILLSEDKVEKIQRDSIEIQEVRRALFTTPRIAKYAFEDTTPVVSKTRFSVKTTQFESIDTTSLFSRTKIVVVTPLQARNKVVQIVLWIVNSGCSKHMTGDRSLLKFFIEKFIGTDRFGNDHFAAITGYGDYVQGNIIVSHVYYVEGLGHNLFSVGQFYDSDLEVAFHSNTTICEIWKEMIYNTSCFRTMYDVNKVTNYF
ncbi:hypothetical protein Tco_0865539 [Tanacetum coccineum]